MSIEQIADGTMDRLVARRKQVESGVVRLHGRKQVEQNFLEAFELVGGVQRLALWANQPENYGKFVELYIKLAPKGVVDAVESASVTYISHVPQSPLNKTMVDAGTRGRLAEDATIIE